LLAACGTELGQHLLFDGVDRLMAGAKGRVPLLGEICLQNAAVDGMRAPGHPSLVLEFPQELVHGLRGAVVFTSVPIPFAVREPVADLDATSRLGWGWRCG
jgi:hypothetical protein